MDVLEIIKAKRKSLGITQEKMAKLLCIPRSTYNNIENNIIELKVYYLFQICKILEIPLETFQNRECVVIEKNDLHVLMKATEQIQSVARKIENNISIVNNDTINMNFTNTSFKGEKKPKRCAICGEPAGFYPLCKHHLTLKEQGKVYKNSKGYWVLKEN
jgi:transcriptional regulator with XRE-family HTH domain